MLQLSSCMLRWRWGVSSRWLFLWLGCCADCCCCPACMPGTFQACKEQVSDAVNSMMLCWLTCPNQIVLLAIVAVSRSSVAAFDKQIADTLCRWYWTRQCLHVAAEYGAGKSELHSCKSEHIHATMAGITCCCQGSKAFKNTTGTPASFCHHCHF